MQGGMMLEGWLDPSAFECGSYVCVLQIWRP